MFLAENDGKQGIYALKFFKNLIPVTILIDDFIVIYEEFILTMESHLWAHLVEKAWAKLHGSYFNSFNLDKPTHEIYQDLTGAETRSLDLKDTTFEQI